MNWDSRILREVKQVLHLTIVRDDYKNSEYHYEISFLGGALLQYAWCTQNINNPLNEDEVLTHFNNLVNFKYEGVNIGRLSVDRFMEYTADGSRSVNLTSAMYRRVRNSLTKEKFYESLETSREYIKDDLRLNERVSIIAILGYFLYDEAINFCNENILNDFVEEYLKDLEGHVNIVPNTYIHNGIPLIRNQKIYEEFRNSFQGKNFEMLKHLEEKSKSLFLSGKEVLENLTNEELKYLDMFRRKSLDYISSGYKQSDFKDLMRITISVNEDAIIKVLYDSTECFNNLDSALYEASLKLIDNELNLSMLISSSLIKSCMREIDTLIDLANRITNINMALGNQLAKISMISGSYNCDKYAMILRNYGRNQAKYWIANITFEIDSRVQFYTDFVKEELRSKRAEKHYKPDEEKVIMKAEKANKSLRTITKYRELNKIASNKGFEKIRQKGDHGIFKRYDGTTVVIPQGRTIGKGLSHKIQKYIARC